MQAQIQAKFTSISIAEARGDGQHLVIESLWYNYKVVI